MRKIFQAIFALVLLLTVSLFAQNMCIELCTPCQNKKDQTCKKVDKHCQCAALLDSINAAQASKDAAFAESINKLSDELLQTCDETVCARNIAFENGIFKEIKQGPSPFSNETKQSLYETKFNNTQPEMSRIEPLPPMTEECTGFCGDCPVTDKMLKAKKPKFKDKFCKKIEQSCKCIDYAINKKQLEEQAKADSVAEFESKVQRIENAKLLAKQIQDQTTGDSVQAFTVIFANKEMVALDIQKAEIASKEKEQETVATIEEKMTDSAQTSDLQESSDKETSETAFSEQNQDKRVFHEVDPSSSFKREKTSKDESSYIGFSLAFEFPESKDFYGIWFHGAPKDYDFGIDLGFLFRTYFNKVVSFNLGFNAIYRLAEYNGEYLSIKFSTLMAEIPLGFRFGIPLGPLPVSPFISTSFHIRKPIYHWIDLENGHHYSWIDDSGDRAAAQEPGRRIDDSADGAAAIDEWEFVPLLGAGLEISRHFSFEFQWYLGSFCIHDGSFHDAYEYGSSWRLKFEAAF